MFEYRFKKPCTTHLPKIHVFYVDQHITFLEVNRIVTARVDSVARTLTLNRGVSTDELGY